MAASWLSRPAGAPMIDRTRPQVLFVCLGNICRSPTAEAVFRKLAAEAGLPVDVDSAGTGAWHAGAAPDARASAAAAARGYSLDGITARRVAPADFTRFDLILAMDRDNLSVLRRMMPEASRAEVRLLIDEGRRGREVPDPWITGRFGEALDLIEAACRRLVTRMGG